MTTTMASTASSANEVRANIVRRLLALKGLPTTIAVAVRLFELQKEPGAEAPDYARVIATDAGMTARILALANSSWYGVSTRITQPMVAVNLLGVPAVRTLAINFCLSGLHHELRLTKTESQEFWEASLCKAVAARHLAQHLAPATAEDAYVAGLFQDMALPVMFATARDLVGPLLEKRLGAKWLLEAERNLCGASHTEYGEMLARHLGLPEQQGRLVGAHHDFEALRQVAECEAKAAGAYAASLFPHRLDRWDAGDVESLRAFLASPSGGGLELEAFLAEVSAECRREFAFFDRSKITEVRLLEMMNDAIHEAAESAVQLVGQVQEMRQQVATADQTMSRLAEEAARDALTGVLNRAGFEKECRAALVRVMHERQPVALIFLDVDRFKEINDVAGHAAGDEALRQIAAMTRECTRATDLVGRLGGDEFAVLLPNCPREKAAEIAERLRARVASRHVEARPLSMSVGVRWTGAGAPTTLEWLMTAADQYMYAAKRDGGNQVCIQDD